MRKPSGTRYIGLIIRLFKSSYSEPIQLNAELGLQRSKWVIDKLWVSTLAWGRPATKFRKQNASTKNYEKLQWSIE